MLITGLECWDWDDQGVVPEGPLCAVMDHPAFALAHRRAVEGALAYAGQNPLFQTMHLDIGAFFLCFVALYMDATTGITHRHLRDLTGGQGLISAGRATAILWRLRACRFVETGPGNRFVPTTLMREGMRARVRVEYEALRPLEPNVAPLLARFDDDRVFAGIVRNLGADMLLQTGGDRPHDAGLINLNRIAGRAAGMLILYALIAATPAGGAYPPGGIAGVSVSALARDFGVSRRQVLRLLREMAAAGFIVAQADNWMLLPHLGRTLRLFQGLLFVRQLRAGHRALLEADGATIRPLRP